jgi:hypothetical protein
MPRSNDGTHELRSALVGVFIQTLRVRFGQLKRSGRSSLKATCCIQNVPNIGNTGVPSNSNDHDYSDKKLVGQQENSLYSLYSETCSIDCSLACP